MILGCRSIPLAQTTAVFGKLIFHTYEQPNYFQVATNFPPVLVVLDGVLNNNKSWHDGHFFVYYIWKQQVEIVCKIILCAMLKNLLCWPVETNIYFLGSIKVKPKIIRFGMLNDHSLANKAKQKDKIWPGMLYVNSWGGVLAWLSANAVVYYL